MIIRKATIEDIDGIKKLFNSYRIFYGLVSDVEGAGIFLEERLKSNESVIYMVENRDTKIVAFCQLYVSFSSLKLKKNWLLNDLYIDPNFRGLRISKLLINQAKKHCIKTNASGLLLQTKKDNIIANKIYLKEKFKLDSEFNHYSWSTIT